MGRWRPVRNGEVGLAFKGPVRKGVDELVYNIANGWAELPPALEPDVINWNAVLLCIMGPYENG